MIAGVNHIRNTTRYRIEAKRETLIPLTSLAGPLFYLLITPKIRHSLKTPFL